MHPTAMTNGKTFFDCYSSAFAKYAKTRVIEIGSQDVNGSLRDICPKDHEYIGVDFCEAKGVDVVLEDPYSLPFANESADIVVSSSCFEHSELFWLVYLEIMRCLKPHGLFYLNAPSAGTFHRYPVDCWRFYPDSGHALVNWARRNGYKPAMLESFTQVGGKWQDYVAVFLKDESMAGHYPQRILDTKVDFENGQLFMQKEILNLSLQSQNDRKLHAIAGVANEAIYIKS